MDSSPAKTIEQFINSLRKERKKVEVVKRLLDSVTLLLGVLALVSVLSYLSSYPLYFSALKISILVLTGVGFVFFLLPAVLTKESISRLTSEIEKVYSGLGENTLNAILLASNLRSAEKFRGTSKALAQAHISDVTDRLEACDLSPAVPREDVKRGFKNLLIVFPVVVLLLVFQPREFRGYLFSTQILPPSQPGPLELVDIKIHYQYPDYTGLPLRVLEVADGDVKAIKGTNVLFEAALLKSFDVAELLLESGLVVPVELKRRNMEAKFTLLSDGTFFIRGKKGERNWDSRKFTMTVQKDEVPKVEIKFPTDYDLEIEGNENIEFFFKARDDFGLTKLALLWEGREGNGKNGKKGIEEFKSPPLSWEGGFLWELGGVDISPGEVIEARIEALDNDTVSGPKAGVSKTIRVRLKDPRRKHEEVMALIEKALETSVDVLADDIESYREESYKWRSGGALIKDIVEAEEKVALKINDFVRILGEVMDKMKEDEFSDYTLYVGVSNMRSRVKNLLGDRRSYLASFSFSPKELLGLEPLLKREIREFEEDALFLDSMLRGERLKDALFQSREMLGRYEELSRLLKELKETGDEKIKEEIKRKIEELRGLLQELSRRLAEEGLQGLEEFLNPEAFESLNLHSMDEKLNEIMKAISEGRLDEALGALSELRNTLEGMLASLEGAFRSYSMDSLFSEMMKLNDIKRQIDALEREEDELKGETEGLKESLLQSQSGEDLLDFVEREKEKLETLKELLFDIKAGLFQSISRGESRDIREALMLDKILKEVENTQNRLSEFNFKGALEHSRRVEGDISSLESLRNLKREIPGIPEEYGECKRISKEVREDLERLQGKGGGGDKMHSLSKKQDEIEGGASQLSKNLKGFSREDLFLDPGVQEKVDEARRFMKGASRNLRGREISKAISNEEESLRALKEAKEKMEDLLEKYGASAQGRGIPVPFVIGGRSIGSQTGGIAGVDTSHVEIPSAEEFKGSEKLKEELTRALEEGSPEGYDELNKKYYEKIVR